MSRSSQRNKLPWREYLSYNKISGQLSWIKFPGGQVRTGDVAGAKTAAGYLSVQLHKLPTYAHRIAWFLHYGAWPEEWIDHINGDKSDNRIVNLRLCNRISNRANSKPDLGRRFKGIHYRPTRDAWIALITFKKKRHFLGYFKSEERAAIAYDDAAREYHGDFARLNFPNRRTA